MDELICPNCGSEMVGAEYDYDDGHIHYECYECGNTFVDTSLVYCDECGHQVTDFESVEHDGMVFCSKECKEKYINSL